MVKNLLKLKTKKKFSEESPILSTNINTFNKKNEKMNLEFFITKNFVILQKKGFLVRDFKICQIDGISLSLNSSEFILHILNDEDLRLSSYDFRCEIIFSLLDILTDENLNMFKERISIFYVDDISLTIYETKREDLLNKKRRKPDMYYRVMMNKDEFLIKEEEIKIKNLKEKKETKVLFTSNKKTINKEDFELIKSIGKGAHGKVLLCEKKFGKKELYAMKIIKKKHIIEKNQLEHTKAEKIILSHVNHPFLISLKYSFQSQNKLYFIMEFMKGGELFQHLKRIKQFSEKQTKFISACLIMALGHLHNKNYIYRDLKPENVLLDNKGYAKLTDFGLAKFIKKSDIANTFCGTPEYMAPEVILGKGCNRPADWWALGVLLYEMIYGIPPFYSTDVQKMYKRTIIRKLKFKKYCSVSKNCEDFLSGLLMKNPEKRLGAMADSLEVMSHPWFDDFDWTSLMNKTLVPDYNPMEKTKNWEDNFDPCFTNEKPTDSISFIDPKLLKDFQKEFEMFDFNTDFKEDLEQESNKKNSDLVKVTKTPETTDNSKNNITKEEPKLLSKNELEEITRKKSSSNFPFKTPLKKNKKTFKSKKKKNFKSGFKSKQKTNKKLDFGFENDKANTYQKKPHRSPFKFSTIMFDCKASN